MFENVANQHGSNTVMYFDSFVDIHVSIVVFIEMLSSMVTNYRTKDFLRGGNSILLIDVRLVGGFSITKLNLKMNLYPDATIWGIFWK